MSSAKFEPEPTQAILLAVGYALTCWLVQATRTLTPAQREQVYRKIQNQPRGGYHEYRK